MTDLFTPFLIATATTAAANQLSHKPTAAADPQLSAPLGTHLRVNICWTDDGEEKERERQKKYIYIKIPVLAKQRRRPSSEMKTVTLQGDDRRREVEKTKQKETKQNKIDILCCQCIVDRRKSVRVVSL